MLHSPTFYNVEPGQCWGGIGREGREGGLGRKGGKEDCRTESRKKINNMKQCNGKK